jgi:hypothetical protein
MQAFYITFLYYLKRILYRMMLLLKKEVLWANTSYKFL